MNSDSPKKPAPKCLEPNYGKYNKSKKHEQRLGDRLGGKRLPRSGGLAWSKWDKTTANADIKTPEFMFEHKRTIAESMSVKKEWLLKVAEGARRSGKDPGLIVTFEQAPEKPIEWVMIPLDVLERLLKGD